jgi:hypothetical protein
MEAAALMARRSTHAAADMKAHGAAVKGAVGGDARGAVPTRAGAAQSRDTVRGGVDGGWRSSWGRRRARLDEALGTTRWRVTMDAADDGQPYGWTSHQTEASRKIRSSGKQESRDSQARANISSVD